MTLAWGQILLELSITIVGFLFVLAMNSKISNTVITDVCDKYVETANKDAVNKAFCMLNP